MLTYCENLRDVITIHELVDNSIIATTFDKVTGNCTFITDMDSECRKILDNHADTVVCR
jgi:hypothetical protein